MTVRITVRDGQSKLQMELASETTIDEIIEASCDHWKKPQGAYVLKWGNALLRGDMRMDEAAVPSDDVVDLIPDPEGG